DDVTIGVSLSGALTPAGLGMSCLIPLIEAGFIDWIVSTGANLYHDTHFGIGLTMHRGRPDLNDVLLKRDEVVRIYDIVFDYKVLLDTDAFYRKILFAPEFQREMGTAEFHHLIGRVVAERQRALGLARRSLIAAAYEYGVPVYTSSPGDSSIGMNVAARATPSEAVSWGKVDPDRLPDTVVCYCDSTIALPLLSAYALANHPPRKPKRLYERREALMAELVREYHAAHDFGPDGGLKPRR